MAEISNIAVLLDRWFEKGDELACRRVYQELTSRLVATPEAIKELGSAAADEIRQDLLARLLDRESGPLRGVQAPVTYAKTAWRRALVTALRKWGPREARKAEVRQYISGLTERDDHTAAEQRIDATRAVEIADRLSGKGRLAVLLTCRPDRLTDEEWRELVASLPPPPPRRPREPLDRKEASRLLFPPQGSEDAKQRGQRLNSFDKAFKRAVAQIRQALEVES